MSGGVGTGGMTISLENLIALNDEIAALVRAGVPLDRGLQEIGREAPGRRGELAHRIGVRMRAGESLSQILASHDETFPPLWRAVVKAGQRSGRLAAALESMSTSARHLNDLRRALRLSLVYPLIVAAFAFGVFVLLVTFIAPTVRNAYEDMTATEEPVLTMLARIGESAHWWGVMVPFVVVLLLIYGQYRSTRAAFPDTSRVSRITQFFWPPLRRVVREGHAATFAELVALLIEHHVPLPEAIQLAADATGDRTWRESAAELAERMHAGQPPGAVRRQSPGPIRSHLPPLLDWVVNTMACHPAGVSLLRRAGQRHRANAIRAADSTYLYFPIVLTSVVGGSVTLMLGVAVLLPFCRMLYDLGMAH